MKHHVIGVVVGVMLSALVLLSRARHVREAPRALEPVHVVSDVEGSLDEVLMHYVPEVERAIEPTYRDFLRSLDARTRVVLVIRRGDRAKLDAFLARIAAIRSTDARVRVVETDAAMGVWSKDRALVLEPLEDGHVPLLIPPKPRPGEGSRQQDWGIVQSVASLLPGELVAREIPIAFDAGDFAVVSGRVVVDVNLYARNRTRSAKSPEDLLERVKTVFGPDVIMLGHDIGDVPRHHMSMYMALLDKDTALVGDPRAGEALVARDYAPGERSPETALPLRADFSPATLARFDHAAEELAAGGLHVVRIPTVAFDDKTYFAYTNGVYETRAGHKTVRMPVFDEPALDDAARKVYESLGWTVVPISARAVYAQHGTIGCLVNVLRRTP